MASTTTRRKGGAPKSMEMQLEMPQVPVNEFNGKPLKIANTAIPPAAATPTATVKRRKYGTGPFDENWLNLDCCGLICAMVTYGLHLYAIYAVCLILLPPWMSETDPEGVRHLTWMGHLTRLAFSSTAVLAIAAHFKAMTTDPGAVPPDALPLEEPATPTVAELSPSQQPPQRRGKRLCRRCKTFKPKRAHHCSVCGRCIIKMDHHCPWVNNCVGIGNHKYFLLFVFYTFLSCIFSFTLVMVRFYSCMGRKTGHIREHHLACLDRPTQLLPILGLVVEAILFGLFTACMMMDQSSVVSSKMTHIDRLKGGEDEANSSSLAGVIEVFGLEVKRGTDPRFRPDWLSPFAKVCFPPSIRDEIMGFCRPCMRNTDVEVSPRSGDAAPLIRSVAEIV